MGQPIVINGAERGLSKTLEATITENGQQTWLLFVSFLGDSPYNFGLIFDHE